MSLAPTTASTAAFIFFDKPGFGDKVEYQSPEDHGREGGDDAAMLIHVHQWCRINVWGIEDVVQS